MKLRIAGGGGGGGGEGGAGADAAAVLTVWKKSLLFNCTGFTVFDGKGNLVFRVDNYVAGNKSEIVLMDASGKPLLTIRRKVYIYISAVRSSHTFGCSSIDFDFDFVNCRG